MDSLQPTAADFRATGAPVWANNEQEMLCLVYTEKTWLQLPKGVFFFQIVWCTSRASCLYSSEISSYGANPETEKVPPHVCMLKKVPIKTPNDTVYGELSRLPIACVIYDQMCEVLVQTPRAAWSLLFEEILSNICSLAQEGKIKWTSCIKLLLSQTGFAEIRLYVNVVLVMEACSWKSEEKDYVLVFVTAGSVV